MTTLKDKLVTIHPLHQQEPPHSSNEISNESISHLFAKLIENTGESLHREGLQKTPARAAKAFQSLTSGYQVDLKKLVNGAVFECSNKEMVIVKNIEFFSLCEHHLLPMIGRCHVAYAPNGKILGLSKVGRIVDMFAKRLQIQEKLTQQIAEAIMEVTNAEGVAVMTNAVHLCMMARGIAKQHASVDAMSMLGSFKDDINLKHHFIRLAHDLNMAPRQPIIF